MAEIIKSNALCLKTARSLSNPPGFLDESWMSTFVYDLSRPCSYHFRSILAIPCVPLLHRHSAERKQKYGVECFECTAKRQRPRCMTFIKLFAGPIRGGRKKICTLVRWQVQVGCLVPYVTTCCSDAHMHVDEYNIDMWLGVTLITCQTS